MREFISPEEQEWLRRAQAEKVRSTALLLAPLVNKYTKNPNVTWGDIADEAGIGVGLLSDAVCRHLKVENGVWVFVEKK